jgi:8-oxo-dGTP pyrophosphatase MutT (NUDIX family)
MPALRRKAFAYITHNDRLLVFVHPHVPEAGIQVPAGTLKPGERPEAAVMREAVEETGLAELKLTGYLGEARRDMSDFGLDEIHHRTFYHLRCESDPPERWQHYETDLPDGDAEPILFEFFWARLPHGVPDLIADHGSMIPRLIAHLNLEA